MQEPDIWNNPERAQALGKERAQLEAVVERLEKLDRGLNEVAELLTLAGFHLDGASVAVRFANRRLPAPLVLAPRAEASANSLQVQLAGASDAWQAGVYAVSVAVTQADGSIQTSNALAVTLAPHIDAISASRTPSGVEVLVECSPAIWPGQAAALLLGERELQAEAFG